MALLGMLLVLGAGAAILFGYRIYREHQDVAYSDPSAGITFSTELPLTSRAPFDRFPDLLVRPPYDVIEMADEGFDVAYFTIATGHRSRVERACALVQLPVDPPLFNVSEGSPVPEGIGPQTADVLKYLAGVRAQTASHALLAQSISAPADTVQRTALRLARAIVADAKAPEPGVFAFDAGQRVAPTPRAPSSPPGRRSPA